jgi:hypothetical protein
MKKIFCDSCGWNLVKVPKGSKLGFGRGIATKDEEYYYNHNGCITGEEE